MHFYKRTDFAGFWLRFVAFAIDAFIVSIIVLPFAISLGLLAPKAILVEVPLGLFTSSTVIPHELGEDIRIEKEVVLNHWTNFYMVSESKAEDGAISTSRNLVDKDTFSIMSKTTSSDIEFIVIFVYWILFEASVWQASIGKRVMGIKVVTEDGGRPNLFQCACRNLLKILSGITLMIGYLMAGWTDKKQALHDLIPSLFVLKDKSIRIDSSPQVPENITNISK